MNTTLYQLLMMTYTETAVGSGAMLISDATIITAASVLAGAICFLYRQSLLGHRACEDRAKVQDAAISGLHSRLEHILSELVQDTNKSNRDLTRCVKKLARAVVDSSSDAIVSPFADDEEESTDRIVRGRPDHG